MTLMRELLSSAIYTLPDPSTAIPCWWFSFASKALPLSPLKPATPVPAIVLIMPSVFTLRMRLLPSSLMYKLPTVSTAT